MTHKNTGNLKKQRSEITLRQRIVLAYKAFMLKNYKVQLPYEFYSELIPNNNRCDNSRRKSKCNNKAKVALANPVLEIKQTESEHFYHLCYDCALKYIGTDGKISN